MSGASAVMAQDRQKAPSFDAIQLHPMVSRFTQKGGVGMNSRAWGS